MSRTPTSLIARYRAADGIHFGRRDGDGWQRLSDAPWRDGKPQSRWDPDHSITLLTPSEPSKILCIGLNYRAHVAESHTVLPASGPGGVPAEPLVFLKPPSAALAHGGVVRYPAGVERLDPEAEMALVIGRRASRVSEAEAMHCVAGVTCFDDVSARNWQKSDGQWARAKGSDTFAPFGPWLAVGLEASDLAVRCRVNGSPRQEGRTCDLIFGLPGLIAHISRTITLEPGDVIATGTPAGVAPVEPGDRIEVEVEGVGVLAHTIGERES